MRTLQFLVLLLVLCITSSACSGGPSSEDIQRISILQTELEQARSEISVAEGKNMLLSGGLIKVLVEARIEILKITEALIQQRIHALESGAKITIEVTGTESNEGLAKQLLEEIHSQRAELNIARQEAAKYSGGLVAVMKDAAVATQEQSIAMLRQRYLTAKYGLPMIAPVVTSIPASEQGSIRTPSSTTSSGDLKAPNEVRSEILSVKLLSKRINEQDYQKFIWFDIEFAATGLDNPTRAIKGVLNLQDFFGDPHMRINWTINEPINPGQTIVERGTGFKYNQFTNEHHWVLATDLQNMTASFTVSNILYQDGSRRDF